MEGKKAQPRAILVFGAPCSGKTTFSEKFSAKFNAPFYNINDIEKEYDFDRETTLKILDLIAKTHQNVVIEGGLDTEQERDTIRKIFKKAGYDPSLVWIQTDINTIKNRLKNKLRSVAKAKTEYDERMSKIEAPTELENAIVLSGKHTFTTQLTHVLSQLA
ncbi:AAA family ATPase [Candidatus Saccharibacteria bacterium]|nr:AAA family ATPase [Candidatus Saccharibacteria bacterium]